MKISDVRGMLVEKAIDFHYISSYFSWHVSKKQGSWMKQEINARTELFAVSIYRMMGPYSKHSLHYFTIHTHTPHTTKS
jgi:hypothetical protein